MIVSLLFVVLILAVAFSQATQGFFSALIMCVLTICCAAAALGTYEWVAIRWLAPLAPNWLPNYAFAIALGVLFGLPLLVLRLGTDRLVRRSGLIPLWIDRIGAGVCGLITAFIMVGVLANCLLAVPFGTSFIGFARVDIPSKDAPKDGPNPTPPNAEAKMREIWLTPDRFAYAVAGVLSDGIFSGNRSFRHDAPDEVEAGAWINAVASEVSRFAPPGSISIVRTEPVQFVYREIPGPGARRADDMTYEAIAPKSGQTLRMIRVKLKKEAMDSRKNHQFTLRQFRLVGRTDPDEPFQQYHAIAVQQDKTETPPPVNRHIRVKKTKWGDWPVTDDLFAPRDDNSGEVEVVFELPVEFVPSYLEYKRGGRVAVSFEESKEAPRETQPPKPETSTAAEPKPETVPPVAKGGSIRRYTTKSGKSFFGDSLPLPLKAYQRHKNVDIQRNALAAGHLVGFVDEQDEGKEPAVEKFQVDREKRLLHLNIGYLQARSGLGRAISFAVETLQNYFVEDANGNMYEVVGKYAIADVDGRQVVEVQYFSNKSGTIGGLGPFNKIHKDHFKGDYELVFLFLVDPGVKVVAFSTGGEATRRDDLRDENLTAPE